MASLLVACEKPHRVGEHVWVEWEGRRFRAFVVDRLDNGRYRVQFEGCDSHWQRDLPLDKIVSRLDEAESSRVPSNVACVSPGPAATGESLGVGTPYKVGDRVRVRWRGSVYTGSVSGVVAPDKFLIHYEGYENAWDEVVSLERIEGPR
jgi:hypothetical protein